MGERVAVVGGGITGCGIARDLAMRGVEVTLFECHGLNAGTSGRTHGLLHSGVRYAVADPTAAQRCAEENAVVRDIAPHCIIGTGGLLVAVPGDEPYFESALDACGTHDVSIEAVDATSVTGDIPGSVEVVVAARVRDAVVHPAALTAVNAESARRNGARVELHTPVTDLSVSGGAVTGVETVDGEHTFDHVVNATGAWAGEIAAFAGVEVEMAPTRGAMAVLDNPGVEAVLNRARPPSDGDIVLPRGEDVVLGTTSTRVEDPSSYPTPDREIEALMEECSTMVPALEDVPVRDTYWGVRPLYAGGGRDADRGMTLLDHASRDDVGGLTTVVGGKLTTYRWMAETVADGVCERLGVSADCSTAETPLPDSDGGVAELVRRYDASGPADAPSMG